MRTARAPRRSPNAQAHQDGHPSIQRMGAYHRGKLTDEEEEEIREHLLSCRECRELMLELVSFLDGPSRQSRSSGEEIVTAWKQLQSTLGRESGSP